MMMNPGSNLRSEPSSSCPSSPPPLDLARAHLALNEKKEPLSALKLSLADGSARTIPRAKTPSLP